MFGPLIRVTIESMTGDSITKEFPIHGFENLRDFECLHDSIQAHLLTLSKLAIRINTISFSCFDDDGEKVSVQVTILN